MNKLQSPTEISTSRLLLRKREADDAEFCWSYARDPEVMRYLSWPMPESLNDIKQFISNTGKAWDNGESFVYVIVRKEDNKRMGLIDWGIDKTNPVTGDGFAAGLGYLLIKEYWGQGYMTEAVQAIVDEIKKHKGIKRIWTVCDTENIGSAKVLEKNGMQREGLLRKWKVRPNISDEPRDSYCYSLIT